jgi:hypothetical protein
VAYKLLGILVWKGARLFLRRKYGRAMLPKPALAAIVLAGIGVAGVLARSRGASQS